MMMHSKYLLNTTLAFKLFNQKTETSLGEPLNRFFSRFSGQKQYQ